MEVFYSMTDTTKDSIKPPDCIFSKFPDDSETIKEFYANSPTFREICADYEELVIWLETNCQSEKQSSANCEYAREVLQDLEVEIVDCLQRTNKIVNDECMKSAGK